LSPASGEACDAIENGFADLADPILKDRIAELKAARDQARAGAEGPRVRPHGSGRHPHQRSQNVRQDRSQAHAKRRQQSNS
jgi:hypothetical protein